MSTTYELTLGGTSNKTTFISTEFPSPDPSKGWATEWIIIDGTSLNVIPNLVNSGTSGLISGLYSGLMGINKINGTIANEANLNAIKSIVRNVKGSHCYIPAIYIWLRNWGIESYEETALPALTSFSAYNLDKCLTLDIGEL